jgi:hypothetical protein
MTVWMGTRADQSLNWKSCSGSSYNFSAHFPWQTTNNLAIKLQISTNKIGPNFPVHQAPKLDNREEKFQCRKQFLNCLASDQWKRQQTSLKHFGTCSDFEKLAWAAQRSFLVAGKWCHGAILIGPNLALCPASRAQSTQKDELETFERTRRHLLHIHIQDLLFSASSEEDFLRSRINFAIYIHHHVLHGVQLANDFLSQSFSRFTLKMLSYHRLLLFPTVAFPPCRHVAYEFVFISALQTRAWREKSSR